LSARDLFEFAEFTLEVIEGGLQLLAAPGVRGGFEIFEDARARQFEAGSLGLETDLLGGERSLAVDGTPGSGFFHLGFDVFALPAAGHIYHCVTKAF
jgi:hypothetical protein